MKITTWNVNSVNARIEHLIKFIKKDQSDLYLIQELKCTNESFTKEELENINYKNADVLIDKTSIELIKGSKIDYVNELIGSSFKISNPIASSSCGCGTSFSI